MRFPHALYWAAAAVALSPTIAHTVELFVERPWTHYSLIASLLLLRCLCLEKGSGKQSLRGGAGLLGLALILQFFGIVSNSWSISRLGVPVGAMGLALALGRPPLLPVALSFWIVPVPTFVPIIANPWAESFLVSFAGGVVSALGADVTVSGPLLRWGEARFELGSYESGAVTAIVLAELGWYSAVRSPAASWTRAVRKAVIFALAAAVVQPLAVIFAVLLLGWGGPVLAQLWMSHGLWVLTAAVGTASIEYRLARNGHGRRAP